MDIGKKLLLAAVLLAAPLTVTAAKAQDPRDTTVQQQDRNRDQADQRTDRNQTDRNRADRDRSYRDRSDRDRSDRDRYDRDHRGSHYGWQRGHHYGWNRNQHCFVRWHHHHRVRVCR